MSLTQQHLSQRSGALDKKEDVLDGARVYLSGPMDFVVSRKEDKDNGWRVRVSQFLKEHRVKVFDPWYKPTVVGMPHYGKEDEFSHQAREKWTYDRTESGDITRAKLCAEFWPTLHIDLRMVDYSDFVIAYVPSNIYSVGTVHEIVMARLEFKPVLLVSPRIDFPALTELEKHLADQVDVAGTKLLESVKAELAAKSNPRGIPSAWYMALVDSDYFFDGFGWAKYRGLFGWKHNELDEREDLNPPQRPLLPYLEALDKKVPQRYDLEQAKYVENPDWLIFDETLLDGGKEIHQNIRATA